jgi:dihydrofolate reductase
MRKIVAGLYISLDGVIESGWSGHSPAISPTDPLTSTYFNDAEVNQAVAGMMAPNDTMLMGRLTYAGLAAFFAPQTGDYADRMNDMPKFVVSDSMDKADWKNTTVLHSADLAAQIKAIKEQRGASIGVGGSATLIRWLLANDLLDELQLLVFPVILGSGTRLYAEGQAPSELKLIGCRVLSNGVLHLTYVRP